MYTLRVDFNSSTGSLELKKLTVKDTGKYTVSIQPTGTSDQPQKSVDLTVYEKISDATISGLTDELIAGNSSLNLSCQASAGSISNRLWLKDGQSLSPSNRVTFTADNSSMNIKKVEKDDAGQYKCSLSNPISTATAERDVVVNYGPESVTVQGEKTVKINTKVVLQCSASSVPPAGFMWTFNETLTNVKTDTFIIEKANYNDSGNYTCVASNAVTGLKSTSVHTLVVKGDINQSNGGLSGGAIAAIVIVLLLVFAAVGAGIFTMKKKKTEMTGSPSGQGSHTYDHHDQLSSGLCVFVAGFRA
ncbi:carcinoembryonic antigen-related cell adhesion molecule 1-like [Scleropages formosus]|uniref:carcinoembryonic antigen-related cell adhesion molecule 1-like n=1 Tax=Scleropages formosus TaxID=113540 RepID=UPI0010FA9F82|nr:carcinoembryonic antigen-related cell adhesion molecule 1-like [Scleropages formosus]